MGELRFDLIFWFPNIVFALRKKFIFAPLKSSLPQSAVINHNLEPAAGPVFLGMRLASFEDCSEDYLEQRVPLCGLICHSSDDLHSRLSERSFCHLTILSSVVRTISRLMTSCESMQF